MSNERYIIKPSRLSLTDLGMIIREGMKISLSDESQAKILECRKYLEEKLKDDSETYYGINTGFGDLCHVRIDKEQIGELQRNLVMSHACGTGDEVPAEIVRLMLLLKIRNFAYGYSGVSLDLVERLINMYNEDVLPVVYEKGSLGASGDLAPLAHLSLPLIGQGEVYVDGTKQEAAAILKEKSWDPLDLKAKEGLAMLNGTQFMTAYGCWMLIRMDHWLDRADFMAAVSLEAFDGRTDPFDPRIHQIRRQTGQQRTAENIRKFLRESKIARGRKKQIQDPYSFRCVPQVHGACRDVVSHVQLTFENEISGVTDNPNVFYKSDDIISGGNFHGQPLAMALDYLAIGMAEIGSISERRTYKLLNGRQGLPPFLTRQSGLHSGLMIPQYTAAAMASENKQLCTPASVDTIISSNGQEDHVSMGANAATKALRVMKNMEMILAIECFTATQALSLRGAKSSPVIESFMKTYRKEVPFDDKDRPFYKEMDKSLEFLRNFQL